MASSSSSLSSSSSSIFANPGSNVIITQEEFKHFHNIDRKLFLRLVVDISCEPTQATQVMALFLWFEKIGSDFTLVSKLLKCPDALLSDLANEAALVVTCIDNDCFPFITNNNVNSKHYDLPLTQKITKSGITLNFFHENRVSIKGAVIDLISNVCVRAFDDIVQHLLHEKAVKEQMLYYNPMMQQVMYNINAGYKVAVLPPSHVVPTQGNEGSSNWAGGRGGSSDLDAFDFAYSKEFLNNELCEILSRVELSGGVGGGISRAGERRDVPADDRTIFLTFSKGYPITESEIQEFFSRRYGDIIEAVFMQDVQPVLEQPLYARLVLRSDSTSMIGVILDGTRKAKFSINGKHVWARKYVRKNSKSPLIISPVTSLPDSPAASALVSASMSFMD